MRPMAEPVFEQIAPVVDFPAAEARIREFWSRADVFAKTLAKRAGAPRFVFYEGPPTALTRMDHFEKVALVGAPEWVDRIAALTAPLVDISFKNFPTGCLDEALDWLR